MLGGTSGMNFTAILYPSNADFEAWTRLGNNGWTARDMAPYLRKFQTHYEPVPEVAERMRLNECVDRSVKRDEGPMPISYLQGYGKCHEAWMEAFAGLGFDVEGDPIHGKKLGAFTCPTTIYPETQTRAYSASAYYDEKIAQRSNLKVMVNTTVNRIILAGDGHGDSVATGVEICNQNGTIAVVSVQQGGEIILSAGTIKSPQVLELSGISNTELLSRYDIPVVIGNPHVGENMQDHPLSSVSFEVKDEKESGDVMRDMKNKVAAFQQYQADKSGPLSGAHLSLAYLPLVDANGNVKPEVVEQLLQDHHKGSSEQAKTLQHQILIDFLTNQKESTSEYMLLPMQLNTNILGSTDMLDIFDPKSPGNYITIITMLNRPFSRGSVHIVSSDPKDNPELDPAYLADPIDLEALARHTQFIEKIVESAPMRKVLADPPRRVPENCDLYDLEQAKKVTKERCFTTFHPSGTCGMMPKEHGGVVSDKLVVHGTRNLRVVDASIFPMIPVGNIQALVYAVAERAADLIKHDRSEKHNGV